MSENQGSSGESSRTRPGAARFAAPAHLRSALVFLAARMYYLIDGYNLLHAVGILFPRRNEPVTLEQARHKLLEMLHKGHGDEAARVTVVFDASSLPRRGKEEMYHKGIHVCFAVNHERADDLIEMLVRRASVPRNLTVVSDDHRIQQAAQRRGCKQLGCGRYIDLITGLSTQTAPPATQPPGKPDVVSDEEKQHWLDEFADLADDPALKELSDPQEFPDFFNEEESP
jgi:predicted RNA-binding protein with PIN domain